MVGSAKVVEGMHRTRSIVLCFLLMCCSSNEKLRDDKSASPSTVAEIEAVKESDQQGVAAKEGVTRNIHLEGIYEWVYPHNTGDLSENHFIAFIANGDHIEGWYYGTSDEFDEAREGYLPGFFVSRMDNLTTEGDSLFFEITTGYNRCFKNMIPIGQVSHSEILKSNGIWNDFKQDHVLHYRGKVTGLTIELSFKGQLRMYRKERNYFFTGIDNFDPSKCRTETLLAIDENIEHLDESLIRNFLSTFSVICEPNVEFNQWSNELLFTVMEREPEMFVKTLHHNIAKFDTTAIFSVMRSPLLDPDLAAISRKISSVDVDQEVKDKLIGVLTGG